MGTYKNERIHRLESYDEITMDSGKEVDGASGNGSIVEIGAKGTLLLDLTVSALGAGTTLTVTVYTSKDATTWRSLGAFTGASATGTERKSFPGCDRYARANWALAGGTTTATYSVSGEAI